MIQALALMVAWKEPTDGTSGVKMAIAIRLGYQLGLHIARTTPLPDNEHEARVIADRERTWFMLSCECVYTDGADREASTVYTVTSLAYRQLCGWKSSQMLVTSID